MTHGPGACAVAFGQRSKAFPSVFGDLAEHRVHEPLRALALARDQRHGVVDDRVGGHPVEEQELERRQAQGFEHLRVGVGERRLGEGADDRIERAATLDRPDDQLVGERTITVAQPFELGERRQRVVEAAAAGAHAQERVRSGGGRFDDSLAAFPELEGLGDRDRALANELVIGTVKRRGSLDAVVGAFTKAPLADTDAEVLEALRLATFQLLFLDRVPAYAVVDDAVALVARKGKRAQGFVNAVLRKVAEDGRESFATLSEGDGARAWAVRHSCPVWLVKLLRRELGDDAARRGRAGRAGHRRRRRRAASWGDAPEPGPPRRERPASRDRCRARRGG